MGGTWNSAADLIYPIGSVFLGTDDLEYTPANMFGGTWTQVTDRYIRGASLSGTGGATSFTIASSNLPTHTHTYDKTTATAAVTLTAAQSGVQAHSHPLSSDSRWGAFGAVWKIARVSAGNLSGTSKTLLGAGADYNNTTVTRAFDTQNATAKSATSSHTHTPTNTSTNSGDGGFANTAISYNPSYQNFLVWYRTA